MFSKLLDFGYRRTTKEAAIFYFCYLLFFGAIFTFCFWFFVTKGMFAIDQMARTGRFVTMGIVSFFMFAVMFAKKLHTKSFYLALFVVTVGLTYLGGFLLGFLPVAYVTTKK